ncbi:MAG: hypothetical protein PVI90_19195 [Desulfobacteraceae bacterium]|jgi:hypothetical protein
MTQVVLIDILNSVTKESEEHTDPKMGKIIFYTKSNEDSKNYYRQGYPKRKKSVSAD